MISICLIHLIFMYIIDKQFVSFGILFNLSIIIIQSQNIQPNLYQQKSKKISMKNQQLEKQKKILFAKPIIANNPIFSIEHIEELYTIFNIYAQNTRRVDLRDILIAARTLSLDKKNFFVFKAIQEISYELGSDLIDFQSFIKQLTKKVGNPYTKEGRTATFQLLDVEGKEVLELDDIKYINEQLKFGFTELQLQQIIQSVAGYGAKSISVDKWNKFIQRKVERAKTL